MKTLINRKSLILPAGLLLAWATSGQAAFTPIPLQAGSYTHDLIVEKNGPTPVIPGGVTTASMDGGIGNGGDTWNEQGYFTSDTDANVVNVGLPPAGSTISTNKYQFKLAASYTASNAIMLDAGYFTNANWKLTTPASYGVLSFLTSGGNGGAQFRYTLQRQDGTSEVGLTNSADWFSVPNNIAWIANGRVNAQSFTLDNYNSANPRLYSIDVVLSGATSPITNIFLERTGGNADGHTCIMAISGAAAVAGPFLPVLGTGYNADIVVEATAPRRWDRNPPSVIPTSVTMDGGADNLNNTWFEQGYYTRSNTFGIPPANSTFTTEGDAGHQFKMAPDYTQPNSFFLDAVAPSATLTLATPAAYSALSILTASAAGSASLEVVVTHADSSIETNYITSPDWFNNAPRAWTSYGRINVTSGVFENLNNDNPRLYYSDFALANTASAVTSVTINYTNSGQRIAVFALAGTSGAVPPLITAQPASIRTWAGSNITFSVTAAGTEPLSYKWQKGTNGVYVDISGQTTPSYTLNNVQVTDIADYRVVVSNGGGSLNSQAAVLTVLSPLPVITLPTDAITAYQPNGGNSPGGEPVANAIDSTTGKYLNFANGVSPFTGPIGFIVNPSSGRTTVSAIRFYTANDATERDPANYILEGSNDGQTFTLISSNSITLPDGRNAGAPLDPLTQNMLQVIFPNTTPYAAYRLSFTRLKAASSIMQIGEVEMLGVKDTSGFPVVTMQPTSVTVPVGSPFQLTIAANGTPAPTFQWKKGTNNVYVNVVDSSNVTGSKTATLSVTAASLTDAADYVAVVSNNQGTLSTAIAKVTVITTLTDVTMAGDVITGFGDESDTYYGAATNANNAIDDNAGMWRNGGSGFSAAAGFPPFQGPVGLIIEPTAGTGGPTNTLVSGLRIYTGDADPVRDPADYKLEGSNDGGASWRLISSGDLNLPTARNASTVAIDPSQAAMQEVLFPNSVSYSSYRLTFLHTRNDNTAPVLQIADLELLGVTAGRSPALTFGKTGNTLAITSSSPGTLQSTTALNGANTVWVDEGPINGTRNIAIGAGIKLYRVLAQ
jgi:hypothetical protein